MMFEPKGYWSSVFYQATLLMKTRQGVTGEVAFWLARDIVDQNVESAPPEGPALPFARQPMECELVLAP